VCFDFQTSAVQFCDLTNTMGMSHLKVVSILVSFSFTALISFLWTPWNTWKAWRYSSRYS